ncbi:hypothetical protein I316_07032 [Kwoniella heveanensis BCC8398]|uniref:Uncharacterized protein n=1 Tax=Kwoniella heveanensis BCC8398 TaxID=1296120 RepID=A0A1B9GJT4_9TREE|nr:hypothetical protein I316_07032 [Kwoniella heveanensis BCC8398]
MSNQRPYGYTFTPPGEEGNAGSPPVQVPPHTAPAESPAQAGSSAFPQAGLVRSNSADPACPPCEPATQEDSRPHAYDDGRARYGRSSPARFGTMDSGRSGSSNGVVNIAGVGRSLPRRKATVLPAITTSALGDLSLSHPSPVQSPGRRRAHTVGVSFRPNPNNLSSNINSNIAQRALEAGEREDRLTPLGSGTIRGRGQEGDLENGLGNGLATGSAMEAAAPADGGLGRVRSSSTTSASGHGGRPRRSSTPVEFDLGHHDQLNDDVIGLLDVIDPHVSTVNHLQNMTNSVLVPHIPQLWKRRPEVQLPETPSDESLAPLSGSYDTSTPPPSSRLRSATVRSRKSSISRFIPGWNPSESTVPNAEPSLSATGTADWGKATPVRIPEEAPMLDDQLSAPPRRTIPTDTDYTQARGIAGADSPRPMTPLSSAVAEVEEQELEDDIADIKEDHKLDRHVKHVLRQSKRQKIKRGLQGLWTFVKTPMGAITAIYGFLVAFWGAGIVLFLLGWIPTSSKERKSVWVEICSQVENGLFTITGVGLIPWRAIDTYRMSRIWTLRERSRRLRKKRGLPPIEDPNDLPDPELIKDYVEVLSEKDRKELRYQQDKFAISQTWYRPHATATHRAFPMKWALWNTILMDGNSFFQCGCMWGMTWRERPAWTTGCLIPLSFLCGIGAALLIWQGSARTKKTPAVSQKLREALGVPIAIAVPRTADGTVLTHAGNNNAPATDIPLHKTESPNKPGYKTAGGGRRTTVTFGHVSDGMGYDGHGKRGEGEKGRDRARTVAAPERGPGMSADNDNDNGTDEGAISSGETDEKGEMIGLKEVKSVA